MAETAKKKSNWRKRRLILLGIPLTALMLTGAIHLGHSVFVDDKVHYVTVPFYSTKVSEELDGYTIAFVTDTHSFPGYRLREMTEQIQARQPDLLLLGGDFPARDAAWRSMEILSAITPADGIYGVEGNHDSYRTLFPAMRANGITPLDNTGVRLRDGLYLGGVQDLQNRRPDVRAAIAGAEDDDFILLLSHNPDVSMKEGSAGVDLFLSGHTHGGEVSLFGQWAPAVALTSSYGLKFSGGWAENHLGIPVYVSNGIGSHLPIRVFAPRQVIFIELHHTEA